MTLAFIFIFSHVVFFCSKGKANNAFTFEKMGIMYGITKMSKKRIFMHNEFRDKNALIISILWLMIDYNV